MKQPISHLRAIGFALAGYALWTIGDMFMKLAAGTGMPKYEIMGFGGAGGWVTIVLLTFSSDDGLKKLKPRRPGILVLLGLLYAANYILLAWCLLRLPIADLYTVVFLAPLVIVIFAALFLRESLTWRQGFAIMAGFVGVVIAVNPAGLLGNSYYMLAYIGAFACMLGNAAQMLILRVIGPHEHRQSIIFFQRITAITCSLAIGLALGFAPAPIWAMGYALVSGVAGSLGWLCMANAYKLAPAATVAPFHYSQLVTGALFGYLIWHDVPSAHLAAGAVIIVAAGLYIAAHARRAERLARMLAENP